MKSFQKFQIINFLLIRTGSARTDIYGPDYFITKDVVLVTFNYRLQAFGFLSLDDRELGIPGEFLFFSKISRNSRTSH